MLQFQRVIANGRPVFVPANPARNFMGEAQEAVSFDAPGKVGRWVPPSRRYQVTGWRDRYPGRQPGDPQILVDHAPPPVGYHYDDKYQLVADAPGAPVVAVTPKPAPAPVVAPVPGDFFATVTGWVSAHPYLAALGGAVAVYLLFLHGGKGRGF